MTKKEYQSASIGVNSNLLTSKSPRGVSFISGITGRLKNESVIKGSISRLIPSSFQASSKRLFKVWLTSTKFLSDIKPAIGRDKEPMTVPSFTRIIPPPILLSSFIATKMSLSLSPAEIILWESWAIVVAIAPPWIP